MRENLLGRTGLQISELAQGAAGGRDVQARRAVEDWVWGWLTRSGDMHYNACMKYSSIG
jgi:hypothetical protein